MDQFSTPPELGALAVLAAQVRPGDRVLEPSAGTGLLAILAEACGGDLTLNERAAGRSSLLEGLFPLAARSQHDAVHLQDLLAGRRARFTSPWSTRRSSTSSCICSARWLVWRTAAASPPSYRLACSTMGRRCGRLGRGAAWSCVSGSRTAPTPSTGPRSITGLLVVDRGAPDGVIPAVVSAETLADAAQAAAAAVARPTAQARQFRAVNLGALLAPKARALATPAGRLAFLSQTAPVAYDTCPWSGEGHDVGLYQAYQLGRVRFPTATAHPSPLVESGPMASVGAACADLSAGSFPSRWRRGPRSPTPSSRR